MTAAEFRAARKHLGLKLRPMAERIGKGLSTVKRYEAGQTPVPETVRKLVNRLLTDKANADD